MNKHTLTDHEMELIRFSGINEVDRNARARRLRLVVLATLTALLVLKLMA